MKLNEFFTKALSEGGSVPGVGAIHIDEIEPTLDYLEKLLHIDLKNNVLGSVGKKEFSGDMDVALNIPPEEIPAFIEKLNAMPEILELQKTSVIITKVKIANYDQSIETSLSRTGYVQLDFMPGDPDWLKTYYHSPKEGDSKYKGVYRNILLAEIAAHYERVESGGNLPDGRPIKLERFMWSPTQGLVRVVRVPAQNRNGDGYLKKSNTATIDGPWKSPEEIVRVLNLGDIGSLDSFEKLLAAINNKYAPELVEAILRKMASSPNVKQMGIPDELEHFVTGE